MSAPLLSIYIPTYNRKDRLLSQLESLASQAESASVQIIISDNASSYSVEQEVLPLYADRLKIVYERHASNTSVLVNVSCAYAQMSTEWVWMLGDDDVTPSGSIARILADIRSVPCNISMIKYSLVGDMFPANLDRDVFSFADFADYYRSMLKIHRGANSALAGSCAFMSSFVVSPRRLKNYSSNAFFYSYNHIAISVPAFFAMSEGMGMRFSSARVAQYIPPEKGDHWPVINYMLGLCTWRDMPIVASERDKKWFVRFMSTPIPLSMLMKEFRQTYWNRLSYSVYALSKILRECYQYSFPRRVFIMFSYILRRKGKD